MSLCLPPGLFRADRAFELTEASLSALLASAPFPLPPELASARLKRKVEYLAGREAAAEALSLAGLGRPFELRRDEAGQPLWPRGFIGSISHSGDRALALASETKRYQGLGVDIERIMDHERCDRLSVRILHPEDLAFRPEGLSLPAFVTRVFSAKESLYKALYPQVCRYFGFHAARLQHFDVGAGQLSLALTQTLHPFAQGQVFDGAMHASETACETAVWLWR